MAQGVRRDAYPEQTEPAQGPLPWDVRRSATGASGAWAGARQDAVEAALPEGRWGEGAGKWAAQAQAYLLRVAFERRKRPVPADEALPVAEPCRRVLVRSEAQPYVAGAAVEPQAEEAALPKRWAAAVAREWKLEAEALPKRAHSRAQADVRALEAPRVQQRAVLQSLAVAAGRAERQAASLRVRQRMVLPQAERVGQRAAQAAPAPEQRASSPGADAAASQVAAAQPESERPAG